MSECHLPYVASDGCVYCELCGDWLHEDTWATEQIRKVPKLEAENKDLRHLVKEGLEWTDENIENYLKSPKDLNDALEGRG